MHTIDKQAFGAFVASRRKELGYTQKELAQKLFLSDKAVSKWETGASIPDTAMLIPLAGLLGVSVTELLLCRRMEPGVPVETGQVETLLKTAIGYSDEETAARRAGRRKWGLIYGAALLLGAGGWASLLLCRPDFPRAFEALFAMLLTGSILGAVFGAYFCVFAKTRLPAFYDENKLGFYSDGIFRLNLPGVRFNNSNWPHVLTAGRVWSAAAIAILPLSGHLAGALPQLSEKNVTAAAGVLFVVGLFLPLWAVARAHE